MEAESEIEEVKPSTLPFSASFDLSNPLGFLVKVGKEGNFLSKETAEKEITDVVRARKEMLREADMKKKKTEKETVKQGSLKLNTYGLQFQAQSHKSSSRPSIRAALNFAQDEENDDEMEISRQASKTMALKQIKEHHKKALEEDPSAFVYDEIYGDLKKKEEILRIQDSEERKPRYTEHLMKQAERREKEHEIIYERKLAKERAKDERLFADKEKFVAGAYKRKLEEDNKWLAEERLRELQEEKDNVTKKKDWSDFYFNIGKNVAFGARDSEAKEAQRVEEQRNEETRKEKTDKKVTPESEDIESSIEPQAAVSEMKMNSEKRNTLIKKVPLYKRRSDAVAAATRRFLTRHRAKIVD